MLTKTRPLVNGLYTHETDCKIDSSCLCHPKFKFFFTLKVNYLQDKTIEGIQNGKLKIRKEIRELKERLKVATEQIQLFKEKVEQEEANADEN